MYVTDRVPEKEIPDHVEYGLKRSRSAAFGVAEFQIGKDDLTWEKLVEESRTLKRSQKLEMTTLSMREMARFPITPPRLVISDKALAEGHSNDDPEGKEQEEKFLAELKSRLAVTPKKEVYLYIHGFNTGHDGAVMTIAEIWHFLGREGVPIAYSWPAGEGTLRAYGYTEQSGQFTVFHLKQIIRLIASCPEVEKINIVAHSRGTDVGTTAVRELFIETRASGETKEFKFGTVVLAAADLDIDVVIQRLATERIGRAVDRTVLYLHSGDEALSLSNWLTGGFMRLGDATSKIFDKEELETLRHSTRLQVIDAQINKDLGSFDHNYFHASPAVSSDLVMLLRYGLPIGGEYGRPLEVAKSGFWCITDDYPGKLLPAWYQAVTQDDLATEKREESQTSK
jgi:esterase/lipase superfamily enzyme